MLVALRFLHGKEPILATGRDSQVNGRILTGKGGRGKHKKIVRGRSIPGTIYWGMLEESVSGGWLVAEP